MIKFTWFQHDFEIREDDWKSIRKRFDLKRARQPYTCGQYSIKIKCSLCVRYKEERDCSASCPFVPWLNRKQGCLVFLSKIIGEKRLFQVNSAEVRWYHLDDKVARRQLKKLNRIMDKIEKANE